MAIFKLLLCIGFFLKAITANPVEDITTKLNVRDIISNNPGLDQFIEGLASRRNIVRDEVIDTLIIHRVTSQPVVEPKGLSKREPVGGESQNDQGAQDMLQSANDICAQQNGPGKRALYGNCNGNVRQVTCGDPNYRGWGGHAFENCVEPRPVCKLFNARNYKGEIKEFPICQRRELTDDSSTTNQQRVTIKTGVWNFPPSPGFREFADIYAQTDTNLHMDWSYVGYYEDNTQYIAAEPNTISFTAIKAPIKNGKLTFSHTNNIAAAYIYWSPYV